MRIRPFAALSVVAAATLLLAGCTGSADPNATPTPTSTASSECLLDAQPGADSDAIEVTGSGVDLAATLPDTLAFEDIQRTVVAEGTGDDLTVGDLVSGYFKIYDASTGEVLQDSTESAADDSGEVPILLDAQNNQLFTAVLECAPLGSTMAMTFPGKVFGEGASSIVVVAEATELVPLQADGAEQAPVDGMPAVALDDDGKPTITIADDFAAPQTTQIEVLKKGDGPEVASGDMVFVQYMGVLPDGTEFDSSWSRGTPSSFQTTGVVEGFQKALEGQTVGSQVVAVIPASEGYGETGQGSIPANSPLIFVVDILGVQRAAAQQ